MSEEQDRLKALGAAAIAREYDFLARAATPAEPATPATVVPDPQC